MRNAIFTHYDKPDREARLLDTGALLNRRDNFLAALKLEVLEGAAPAELAVAYTQRIFRAMRAAERLALREDTTVGLSYFITYDGLTR